MDIQSKLDKSGFPMIWVEEIGFVHWLPVTKVQMEYFLCEPPADKDYNESWYKELLDLNGRISPWQAKQKDYWKLFLTGIKPEEAQYFAEWCGEDYRIPTLEEWNKIYRKFKEEGALADLASLFKLSGRAGAIVDKIDEIGKKRFSNAPGERKAADQMLLRYGVMEWVEVASRGNNWGGMGITDQAFYSVIRNMDSGTPEIPRNVGERRIRVYGFRLICQE
jgi:hypothetical protein